MTGYTEKWIVHDIAPFSNLSIFESVLEQHAIPLAERASTSPLEALQEACQLFEKEREQWKQERLEF